MTEPARRILVVEDERVVALDLRSSLLRLGYEVTDCVSTGAEAIASAERAPPDLALLDIRLRGEMDGIAVAEHFKTHLDIPVVYLTAYSDDETLQRAQRTDPFGYLLKPFEDRELHVVIEMATFRHRAQREHERLVREQASRAAIEKEHRWVRFLADVSATLSSLLDVRSLYETIPRIPVPHLGDRAALHVRVGEQIESFGCTGSLPSPNSHLRVMSTGKSELLAAQICVPLIVRNETFGALTLAMAESLRRYGTEELEHAMELARRCAISIDNAQLYDRAQRAVALRDEFLSIASHELRTPVSAIQLALHNLERGVRELGSDPLTAKVRRILLQSHRLAELIERLLDVSRISVGKLEIERATFDLGDLVREVADRFSDEARQNSTTIGVDLEGELTGTWDRLRIDQVLTNLLANALKFCDGTPIQVRASGLPEQVVVVTVRDHGLGIEEDKIPLIFERFERGVSARNYGGLGLGLYVARQLIEAHGGTIRVESEAGHGALFTMHLPKGMTER